MTEVQRLAKIMVLKDMRKEYELRAKYNGGVDYDCYRALDMAIDELVQEPCADAISRQAAIDACLNGWNKDYKEIVEEIRALPPVTPAEKVGQWEWNQYDSNPKIGNWHCSQCHGIGKSYYDYCPYCKAKMSASPTGAERSEE